MRFTSAPTIRAIPRSRGLQSPMPLMSRASLAQASHLRESFVAVAQQDLSAYKLLLLSPNPVPSASTAANSFAIVGKLGVRFNAAVAEASRCACNFLSRLSRTRGFNVGQRIPYAGLFIDLDVEVVKDEKSNGR